MTEPSTKYETIMNKEEYEKAKAECWLDTANYCGFSTTDSTKRSAFDSAFDRAYALGKQEKGAEEEEMLCVSRKRVQELYKKFKKDGSNACLYAAATLDALFGPKCLPDDVDSLAHLEPKAKSDFTPIPEKTFVSNWDKSEPKPAEPKFKVGDKVFYVCSITVKHKCTVTKVMQNEHSGKWEYNVLFDYGKPGLYISESDLGPYTEPEEVARMKPIASTVSVYLATKEEDKEFRLLLHENGFRWNSDDSLIDKSLWESDMNHTKIHFAHPDKTVTYNGDKTSDTLTFSEFKKQYFGEETSPNVNHSDINIDELVAKGYVTDPAKSFDTIIKDSFSKERRLNIAVQMIKAMMGCPEIIDRISSAATDSLLDDILSDAFYLTDRLMSECEKGGKS